MRLGVRASTHDIGRYPADSLRLDCASTPDRMRTKISSRWKSAQKLLALNPCRSSRTACNVAWRRPSASGLEHGRYPTGYRHDKAVGSGQSADNRKFGGLHARDSSRKSSGTTRTLSESAVQAGKQLYTGCRLFVNQLGLTQRRECHGAPALRVIG